MQESPKIPAWLAVTWARIQPYPDVRGPIDTVVSVEELGQVVATIEHYAGGDVVITRRAADGSTLPAGRRRVMNTGRRANIDAALAARLEAAGTLGCAL